MLNETVFFLFCFLRRLYPFITRKARTGPVLHRYTIVHGDLDDCSVSHLAEHRLCSCDSEGTSEPAELPSSGTDILGGGGGLGILMHSMVQITHSR